MNFSIIVAVDKHFGIGKNNAIPWHLPADLKYFASITTTVHNPQKKNAVMMGRKTFESIPESRRPLKNRLNVVLSHNSHLDLPKNVLLFFSLDAALGHLAVTADIENVFVIGGGEVFKQAINHPFCQKIYLTQINHIFDCDTFFPQIDPKKFKLINESPAAVDSGIELNFLIYEKINSLL